MRREKKNLGVIKNNIVTTQQKMPIYIKIYYKIFSVYQDIRTEVFDDESQANKYVRHFRDYFYLPSKLSYKQDKCI